MAYTYEIITDRLGDTLVMTDDNGVISFVPINPANADYQAYLNKDKPEAALSTPNV